MNEENLTAAIEAEISKAKQRLDVVYQETESKRAEKTAYESDIANLQKHIAYLKAIEVQNEEEVSKKKAFINGLDSEISAKQNQFSILQKEVVDMDTDLNLKKEIVKGLEKNSVDLLKEMEAEKQRIANSHAEAVQKHRTADDKLDKIRNFVNSL